MAGAVSRGRARSRKLDAVRCMDWTRPSKNNLSSNPNGMLKPNKRSEYAHGGKVACFWVFLKWVVCHCDGCCSKLALHFDGVDIFSVGWIGDCRDARLVNAFPRKR